MKQMHLTSVLKMHENITRLWDLHNGIQIIQLFAQ